MRPLALIISLVGFACLAFGQSRDQYATLVKEASDAYKAKDYKKSLASYREAFEIRGNNPVDLYNAACSASLLKEKETAFNYLNAAVYHGYQNYDHLLKDEDLFLLHSDDEWKHVLKQTKKNADGGTAEFKLMQELQASLLADDPSHILGLATLDFTKANTEKDLKEITAAVKACLDKYKLKDFSKFTRAGTSTKSEIKDGVASQSYTLTTRYIPSFFGANTSQFSITAGPLMTAEMLQLPAGRLSVNKFSFEQNELPRDFDWKKHVDNYLGDLREGIVQLKAITRKQTILAAMDAVPVSKNVIAALNSLRHDDKGSAFIDDFGFAISFSKVVTVPKEEIDQSDPFASFLGNKRTQTLELLFSRDSKKIVIISGSKYGVYIDEGSAIKNLIDVMRKSIVVED